MLLPARASAHRYNGAHSRIAQTLAEDTLADHTGRAK
jgi:hypothetical protein